MEAELPRREEDVVVVAVAAEEEEEEVGLRGRRNHKRGGGGGTTTYSTVSTTKTTTTTNNGNGNGNGGGSVEYYSSNSKTSSSNGGDQVFHYEELNSGKVGISCIVAPANNGDTSPMDGFSGGKGEEVNTVTKTNGLPAVSSVPFLDQSFKEQIIEYTSTRQVVAEHGISETNGLPAVSGFPFLDQSFREQIIEYTSPMQVVAEHGSPSLTTENRQIVTELYLKTLYDKPGPHEFYCPNCETCIQKVIVYRIEMVSRPDPDEFRCTSCFSFLIPAGNWFLQIFKGRDTRGRKESDVVPTPQRDSLVNKAPSVGYSDQVNGTSVVFQPDSELQPAKGITSPEGVGLDYGTIEHQEADVDIEAHSEPDAKNQEISGKHGSESNVAHPKPDSVNFEDDMIYGEGNSSASFGKNTTGGKGAVEAIIDIPGAVISGKLAGDIKESSKGPVEEELPLSVPNVGLSQTAPSVDSESRSGNSLEILKSIVYGGLTQSITSLSVVTSSVSADVAAYDKGIYPTRIAWPLSALPLAKKSGKGLVMDAVNIVALALANLIGGLFITVHHLWELKAEHTRVSDETDDEQVGHYQELLGRKQNFALHATVVILSFIVFGLVPPVVYGYSFSRFDDKDHTLGAVAVASLLCIIGLAIGKAHIQRPSKSYTMTVLYYAVIAITASGLSYVAGNVIKKLVENLGWLKPEAPVGDSLGDASFGVPAWASY